MQGSKLSTVYMWSFNDSTAIIVETGFSSAQSQQHTFSYPGTYRVSVRTANEEGASGVAVTVVVVGKLSF